MKLFLGYIVPFLLVCLPLVFQIVLTRKRLRHRNRLSLFVIFVIILPAALIMPGLAFQMGSEAITAGLPGDEFRCGNAFIAPLFLSYLLDVGGCLVIGIVGGMMYKKPPQSVA